MSERSLWQRDGQDWPNRTASRFVHAAGLCWHVQRLGEGPPLLLVHGTGAATHSWRALAPLLAARFTVVAPDMPGHGFTAMPRGRLSLPYMADALAGLLETLEVSPALVVGHSAGAAILLRMCLDQRIAPRAVVSLNGALLPLGGLAGQLFAPLARLLYTTSFGARLFARRAADPAVIRRMLDGTGSRTDPDALEFYGRLARNPRHVAAALGMMANWDLNPLERELPRLQPSLYLFAGTNDRMIRPAHAARVRRILLAATLLPLPGLGHLAHEEEPAQIAELITGIARTHGVLPAA
jgi:magnesium chelatase accessory protein